MSLRLLVTQGDGECLESSSKKPRGKAASVPYTNDPASSPSCSLRCHTAFPLLVCCCLLEHRCGVRKRGEEMPLSVTGYLFAFSLFWTSDKPWKKNVMQRNEFAEKEVTASVLLQLWGISLNITAMAVSQHRGKGGMSCRKGLDGGEHQRWMTTWVPLGWTGTESLSGDWLSASKYRGRAGSSSLASTAYRLGSFPEPSWHCPPHSCGSFRCLSQGTSVSPLREKPVPWAKTGWIFWFQKKVNRILSFHKWCLMEVQLCSLLGFSNPGRSEPQPINCSP